MSNSGIDWTSVLSNLGKAIQGGYTGATSAKGGIPPWQTNSPAERGATPSTQQPPQMHTQAPIVLPQMHPQPMPGGTAVATAPISPIQIPSGGIGPMPNIWRGSPGMPQFMGSYQMGGIVPQTGLYEVRGGERIIPKKKVAKLHKGEMVVPGARYMGSYQQGGDIPPDPMNIPASPMPPDVLGSSDPTIPQAPTKLDRIKYGIGQIWKGHQEQQQARQDTARDMVSAIGGAGGQPGTPGLPAHVGQVLGAPTVPQMNTVGGAYGAVGGIGGGGAGQIQAPTFPQIPGVAPGAQTNQGPMQYYGGAALPPYQSQFLDKGARAQYITQNLLGGFGNALMIYKQRQWDKKQAEVAATAGQRMQEQLGLGQQAPGQGQGQGAQPQPAGAQPQAAPGNAPTNVVQQGPSPFQQQAQSLGAPGATPTMTTAPQGTAGQPGAQAVQQQQVQQQAQQDPVMAHLTEAYNKEQDPKFKQQLGRTIQQRQKANERAEGNWYRMLSNAQTKPYGPEYQGIMKAYQNVYGQVQAQAEMQTKIAQANAQMLDAQNKAKQLEITNKQMDMWEGIFQPAEPAKPGQPAQPGQAAQPGQDTAQAAQPTKPGDLIDRLKPGPIKTIVDELGDKTPEERAEIGAGLLKSMISLDANGFAESIGKITSERAIGSRMRGSGELMPDDDPNSLTHLMRIYYDANGKVAHITHSAVDARFMPTIRHGQKIGYDVNGGLVLVPETSTSQRVIPGQTPGGVIRPPAGTTTPGATVAPPQGAAADRGAIVPPRRQTTPGGARPTATGAPRNVGGVTVIPVMNADGTQTHKPLSQKAKDSIAQVNFIQDQSNVMRPDIEAVATDLEAGGSTLWNVVRERSSWKKYMSGLDPENINQRSVAAFFPDVDPRIAKLIPTMAQIQLTAAQPYLHGSRNFQFMKQIQQHIPNPETDGPTLMASKLRNLDRGVLEIKASTLIGEGVTPRLTESDANRYMQLALRQVQRQNPRLIPSEVRARAIPLVKQWVTDDGWDQSQISTGPQ